MMVVNLKIVYVLPEPLYEHFQFSINHFTNRNTNSVNEYVKI